MNKTRECQAYVVHLREEHRQLNEASQKIESALAEQSHQQLPAKTSSDFVERLRNLRERLERHFQEEEQGGCIEEAVARCPGLSRSAFDLEHEHVDLRSELDGLIEEAERGQPLHVLESRYEAFAKRLRSHEAQENVILQEGFNVRMD